MIRFLADGLLIILIVVAAVALLTGVPRGQRIKRYGLVVMAGLTALLAARLMGMLPIDTARPFIEAGVAAGAAYMDNPGFPSDHTALAFTLAFAVFFVTKWRRLSLGLFVIAILIGVGRMVALVHTPLDVLGGVVAAAIGALWYLKLR